MTKFEFELDSSSALSSVEEYAVSERWTVELTKRGWTPISNEFLVRYSQLGLKHTEVLVCIHLISFKWDERDPFPTVKTLAERMGITVRSVRAALQSLEEKGLLRRRAASHGGPNRYDLSGLFNALEALIRSERNAALEQAYQEGAEAA